MIQIIAGAKGQGKTKTLIDLANKEVKVSHGHVVYIDDDKSHMYDLHYDVRFVETSSYHIENYKIFFGFICGIISQNSDIETIYIDGITQILKGIQIPQFEKMITLLEGFSEENDVDFIITMNADYEELPESIQKFVG